MKKYYYLVPFILILFSSNLKGINFGGPGIDHGYKIISTADHGYALIGQYESSGSHIYVIKLDSLIQMEWSKTFGNPFEDAYAGDIAQTADGGFLVIGSHLDASTSLRGWLLRLNNTGDTLWTRTYTDNPQYQDVGSYVEVKNDGGIKIGINIDGLTASNYLYLFDADTSGLITDTFSISTEFGKILPLSNGYLMTATDNSLFPGAINLFCVDSLGATIFSKDYYDTNFSQAINGNSSATCGSGYLTVGSTNLYTINPGDYEFYLMRSDSAGDSLWSRHWGTGNSALTFIVKDVSSNYLIAGRSDASGTSQDFIWKADSVGDTLWVKYLDTDLKINSLLLSASGGFIAVGDTIDSTNGLSDVWIMSYDSLGNPVTNPSTNVNENQLANKLLINVFPNPVSDVLNVDCGNSFEDIKGFKMILQNTIGEILFSKSITQKSNAIDIKKLPDEIYMFYLFNRDGKIVYMKKIVKQ